MKEQEEKEKENKNKKTKRKKNIRKIQLESNMTNVISYVVLSLKENVLLLNSKKRVK